MLKFGKFYLRFEDVDVVNCSFVFSKRRKVLENGNILDGGVFELVFKVVVGLDMFVDVV